MNEDLTKRILKILGVSSGVIIFILIIVAVFFIYKNYQEAVNLTLNNKILKKELEEMNNNT